MVNNWNFDISVFDFHTLVFTPNFHFHKMPNVKALIWFLHPSFLHFIRYLVHLLFHMWTDTHLSLNRHLFEQKLLPAVYMCTHKLVSFLHVCTPSLCIHRTTQKPKTYGQQKYIIQSSNFRFVFSKCCLITQKQRQNQ